jgi:hypothetical protein
VIQAIHKGAEIELEIHQLPQGRWKCDYTLTKHPERTKMIHHRGEEFTSEDMAEEHGLQEARDAIDLDSKGQPEKEAMNPPRQVRI